MLKKMLMPLLFSSVLLAAQEVSTAFGDWQLRTDADGRIAVAYAGKTLIANLSIGAFKPGWRGSRYNFHNASMSQEGNSVSWHKQNQEADTTLTLTFTDKKLRIELNMLAQPSGPVEFGIYIPLQDMTTEGGSVFLRGDGRSIGINKHEKLASRPFSKLVFDLPDACYGFARTEGPFAFSLQDRRDANQNLLRYIMSTNVDDEAKNIVSAVELSVDTFGSEEAARRQRYFRTPLRRVSAVALANAGFEEGLDGWQGGKTASIDREVAYQGSQSACLEVADPMTEPVYITRMVPVTGGMGYDVSCFVKTENVVAKPGKMSSVGAGLIVEWADRNGKWLAAGLYACDLYGDNDWQLKSCQGLRAPNDAGYATIFLALRDAGKAWFDEVSMRQIEVSVNKISPEPDAILDTNTPFFSWMPLAGIDAYVLELSQDEQFPATAATRSYTLGVDSSWQLREALPPGTWYWRVGNTGSPDIQPWSFSHAVPEERDCLPPIILGRAWRITRPDAEISILVSDSSPQAPSLTITIDEGQAVSVSQARLQSKDHFEYRLSMPGGWPQGLNTLSVSAMDQNGNRAEQTLWLLNSPKPADSVVIDAQGNYAQDGQVIFPLGIYEVQARDMARVKEGGFEIVHTYRWEGSQDDVACREYLDACHANGLRAFIGFDRGTGSGNGMVQGNFAHLAKRVGALADHPGLFCWYLYDEPEIARQYVSPALLTELAELVRALDPYHPVVMTTWGKGMNKYRRTWDTHWTQSYHKPATIVKTIASHRELLLNDSPITLLVHCYDQTQTKAYRNKQPVDPALFAPDPDWMRAAAYVGIVKSVNGLWWWWYAAHQAQFYSVGQVPTAWEALCAVVKDIRELRPLLCAPGEVESGSVEVQKDACVEWWAKTVNGKQTLIAVNTSEEPLETIIKLPGKKALPLSFQRYEVKVIEP
jgi:hypothetical protein